MSETSSYKSEIIVPKPQLQAMRGNIKGTPCMEIMRLAMEKAARDRNGSLCSSYLDCNGALIQSLTGLKTRSFPSGIGVDVDTDGRVFFKYDSRAEGSSEAKEICDEITRNYAVIAILRVQKKHGYSFHEVADERANTRITAIRA